ncbi:MAG TPA: MFS transporter [Candidatus Limnocylindrales bacterium]
MTRPAIAGIALFVGSLALRPQIVTIGPLAPSIANDLSVNHAFVGLLTTVPVLCMGIFAPLGPLIAARVGARRAMALGLLILGASALVRVTSSAAVPFLAATLGIGIGTGVSGPIPSILTKLHAPERAAVVGGAASAGIIAGAVASAASVVPVAEALGGWRPALALLAAVGLATTAGWFVLLGGDPLASLALPARTPVWRLRSSWLLALVFGLQATLYWGGTAWLAETYVERGWTEAAAGELIGLLQGSALAASIAVAAFSDRAGPRLMQIRMSAAGTLAAALGFVALPSAAFAWTTILGLSLGAIFPLLLIYPIDISLTPARAGTLSGFMLLVGYTIAAVGPLGLGAVRDVSGGFQATFGILAIVATLLLITGSLVPRSHLPASSATPSIG